MKTFPRSSAEHHLLETPQVRSVGPFEGASIFDLTSTVQYAIEARLPNTLTSLLRELGRRGGLVVSVEPEIQPLRPMVAPQQMRSQA